MNTISVRIKAFFDVTVIVLLLTVFLTTTLGSLYAEEPKLTKKLVPCWNGLGDLYTKDKSKKPKETRSSTNLKCKKLKEWKQEDFVKKPARTKDFPIVPSVNHPITPAFEPPRNTPNKGSAEKPKPTKAPEKTGLNLLDFIPLIFNLFPAATAATANQYGDIMIDGDLSDWTLDDRINLPLNLPPYLATGDELYGKYVETPTPTYVIALKTTSAIIGYDTTFWLNIDQDANTGYRIWDSYGGAEYFVNIYTDSTPHLYNDTFNWILGPLDHAYGPDQQILELAIPADSLPPLTPPQAIDLLGDINDVEFLFPQDYATDGQYTIPGAPEVLPPRTSLNKRVGIVYGSATKDLFFGDKAYSQLFMSLQHQVMMAGIPFDLLTENDLTDVANIVNYDAIIFPYFAYVPSAIRDAVHDTLYKAIYKYGIGIVTADNWITNDEAGAAIPGDSYRYMKQLLGIDRVDGEGPVQITVNSGDVSHRAMEGYAADELIISYDQHWYSYFEGVPGQLVTTLVNQNVTGSQSGIYPAVLATQTGGRHVHFASLELMADTNLTWQALQWVLFGDQSAVGLKLGRNKNLFLARNDTDQSQEHDEVAIVHVPLLELIGNWKEDYNFVGSYYINIGNDPANGQWTDWSVSAPLFRDYIALDNEVGTHSWTHPNFTDDLTASEIEFEFNQSMNKISTEIGFLWQGQDIRGGAVPGAPEARDTAQEIIQYLDYLTGGYSAIGAGYPSAFGYLTPDSNKVYFSPNMSFDFTLIEFGVPVGNPPVPTPLSAEEAEQYWQGEYQRLMTHAAQPIVLWPWHDYGPTIGTDPVTGDGYTVAMFENTIAMVHNDGAEFATLADAAQRISTFKDANLMMDYFDSMITATVNTPGVGKFALAVNTEPGQLIQSVDNWYAYNNDRVFLDDNGGAYVMRLGNFQDNVSHITKLPMRARLLSLSGDGSGLSFTFEGEGQVRVALNGDSSNYNINGADSVVQYAGDEIGMSFDTFGLHTGSITPQ